MDHESSGHFFLRSFFLILIKIQEFYQSLILILLEVVDLGYESLNSSKYFYNFPLKRMKRHEKILIYLSSR